MTGIFKKMFGGKDKERAFRERSPRVRVPLVDNAAFVVAGKSYPLRNLSETGLALSTLGENLPDTLRGEIQVSGEKVAVELLVARRNGDDLGARFGDGAAQVRALLRRIFTDEIRALEMTEVDSSKQKAVEIGQPRWFYAPGNLELFYVEHEGKVIRFEMEWNGNILSFADGLLRYGKIDRENREEVEHARSSLVKWNDKVDSEHKRKALSLLENIPGLEAQPKQQMQTVLKA